MLGDLGGNSTDQEPRLEILVAVAHFEMRTLKMKTLKTFGKYTLVWISQNLAIPFWIVGHIHLSVHSFHDLYEIFASLGMNIIVLIGFIIDYKDVTKQIKEKS